MKLLKKLAVIFLSVILLYSCNDEDSEIINYNQHEISDSLNQIIMEDAFRLTLKILREDESYNDDIELPEELFSPIYNGLIKLYQADDSVLDTIFRITPIHCHPSPESKWLVIYSDSTAKWADRWFQDSLISRTNVPELDSLLETIHAEFWLASKMTLLGGGYQIIITFPDYWNLYALRQKFANIEGIYAVTLETFGVHTSTLTDIDVQIETEGIYLTFILKTNCDFLGGCENYYSWDIFISNETGNYQIIR